VLRRLLLPLLLLLLLAGCTQPPIRRQIAGVAEVPAIRGPGGRPFHYLLSLPTGYEDDKSRQWPLLVYLPGFASVGKDVRVLTRGGPPYEIEMGREIPMVVISAMTPAAFEAWTPHKIISIVDHALERYRIDPSRVCLTGLSLGGVGVWEAAMAYPDRFAAVVPVCAHGNPCDIERMVDVPVWAFHGGIDFVIPPPFHARMVKAHRAAGGHPRWTVFPWCFHWVWDRVYAMDELYIWMLEQRVGPERSQAAAPESEAAGSGQGRRVPVRRRIGHRPPQRSVASRGTPPSDS